MRKKRQPGKDGALEALAEVLRPIAVAMLKGNLSASALVRAAKYAYLQAAIDTLKIEGKTKPNVSRLAVITGMTRKEISSYLPRKAGTVASAGPRKQMEHRALRVLRAWATDPRYKALSGRVIDLPIEGEGKSFASLVRSHGGDVTTVAVLRELERLRAVTRSSLGLLHVRSARVRDQLRSPMRFRDFSRVLADFSGTAGQLLVQRENPPYFGFRELEIVTESQAARFKDAFGKRASLLLDGVEHWRAREGRTPNPSRENSERSVRRVGVGIYLFEERPASGLRPLRDKIG